MKPWQFLLGVGVSFGLLVGVGALLSEHDKVRQRQQALDEQQTRATESERQLAQRSAKQSAELERQKKELAASKARYNDELAAARARLRDEQAASTRRQAELASQRQQLERRKQELDDQEQKLRQRARAAALVREAERRLLGAVPSRERALTDLAAIRAGTRAVDRVVQVVAAAVAAGERQSAWEARAREESLRELMQAREERELVGNLDSFRAAAAVELELAHFRRLAEEVGLPADLVPDNEFLLLDRGRLDDLERRWSAKRDEVRKREALAPGAFTRAVEQAEARLMRIRAARGAAQVQLAAQLIPALLAGPAVNPALLLWLEEDQGRREAQISLREAQLLAAALARDRTNLAAYLRLVEVTLELPRADLPDAVLGARQAEVLTRGRAFWLGWSVADRGAELVRRRYADPLGAVALEAILRRQWQETPGEHAGSFERWMVSHLSDGQLYKLKVFAELALLRMQFIDVLLAGGPHAQARDRAAAEREMGAIRAEIAARAGKPGPTARLADVPEATLRSHLLLPGRDPFADRNLRHHYWNSLERYLAWAGPDAEGLAVRRRLALAGHADQVEDLGKAARRLREFESQLRSYGEAPEGLPDYALVRKALTEGWASVEQALDALARPGADLAQVEKLRQRVRQNLEGIPPPAANAASARAAEPYGVFPSLEQTREKLRALRPQADQARARWVDRQREEAQRKAEAERQAELTRRSHLPDGTHVRYPEATFYKRIKLAAPSPEDLRLGRVAHNFKEVDVYYLGAKAGPAPYLIEGQRCSLVNLGADGLTSPLAGTRSRLSGGAAAFPTVVVMQGLGDGQMGYVIGDWETGISARTGAYGGGPPTLRSRTFDSSYGLDNLLTDEAVRAALLENPSLRRAYEAGALRLGGAGLSSGYPSLGGTDLYRGYPSLGGVGWPRTEVRIGGLNRPFEVKPTVRPFEMPRLYTPRPTYTLPRILPRGR
ncbi:MAG TPA: hypothetical protein VFE78_21245 [Gemmataceae bacterium]|jgi:hypothetical protein|nr:hypothetical protein [Gemmataceae bacterium]